MPHVAHGLAQARAPRGGLGLDRADMAARRRRGRPGPRTRRRSPRGPGRRRSARRAKPASAGPPSMPAEAPMFSAALPSRSSPAGSQGGDGRRARHRAGRRRRACRPRTRAPARAGGRRTRPAAPGRRAARPRPRRSPTSTRATGRPSRRALRAGTTKAGRNFAATKSAVVAIGSPVRVVDEDRQRDGRHPLGDPVERVGGGEAPEPGHAQCELQIPHAPPIDRSSTALER